VTLTETLPWLLGATAILLLLLYVNLRIASPLLAIPIRWLRWTLFALLAAELNLRGGWIDRPYWVVLLTGLLVWLLGESAFNWLRVSAISLSPLPLFPTFVVNSNGGEWPINRRLLKVRDWLRANHFTAVQALKSEIGGGIWLRVSVYQNQDRTVRLQVAFLPQESDAITVCYSISSETQSGRRYITDNIFLPFGGFYPENWFVDRSPWRRTLPRMLTYHLKRLKEAGETSVAWESDPMDDLNRQQRQMEQINTQMGFLVPNAEREEHGKITPEGRFRIWKEAWLLDYFGLPTRYE